MENWEKKEGKVNLKRVFNPPFDGHIPHGTSCRKDGCLGQEQAHELGMASGEDLLSPHVHLGTLWESPGRLCCHTPISAAKDEPPLQFHNQLIWELLLH